MTEPGEGGGAGKGGIDEMPPGTILESCCMGAAGGNCGTEAGEPTKGAGAGGPGKVGGTIAVVGTAGADNPESACGFAFRGGASGFTIAGASDGTGTPGTTGGAYCAVSWAATISAGVRSIAGGATGRPVVPAVAGALAAEPFFLSDDDGLAFFAH